MSLKKRAVPGGKIQRIANGAIDAGWQVGSAIAVDPLPGPGKRRGFGVAGAEMETAHRGCLLNHRSVLPDFAGSAVQAWLEPLAEDVDHAALVFEDLLVGHGGSFHARFQAIILAASAWQVRARE